MQRESLDELIDRVGRQMTLAAGDGTLSTRIRSHLHDRSRWPRGLIAAAAAAAVLLIAVVWNTTRATGPAPVEQIDTLASQPLAPVAPLPVFRPSSGAFLQHQPQSRVAPAADLEVAPLIIEPIALDMPADLAPLAVDDIRIDAIQGGVHKE